ncbi:hypothetical protein LIER_27948 [Lithospermum erythrorhizon]|uniref:Cycloidea-like protein n=1 Tax=Lithospermum erythrorhizon TaxID=34254 RepID=A0AAV3RFW4_LITER
MFPSSDSNPFPHFPHHLYFSSSSLGQTNNNFISQTLFHHQQVYQSQILKQTFDDGKQENGVPINLFDGTTSSNTKAEFVSENMNVYGDNYQYAPLDIIPARCQPPGKKDRHSKIVTAQGPRDRRVRLSIDIAKKFFGLQDMLGFDKASKTLDWLLTKSKIAIEEVAQSKMKNTHIESDPEMMTNDVSGKGKRSAKEYNRVKARERARERTRRKKMCILADHNNLYDHTLISPSTSNSNQSLPLSKMGDCKISEVDLDTNCHVHSNLFPQVSSCKELHQIKKNNFNSSSSMYDGPSNNSCPQDHFFPCTSTSNWESNT